MEERSLAGEVAVVTGGGSGIGAACVNALAGAGMKVVFSVLREERLAAMPARDGVIGVQMDVRDPSGARQLIERATSEFGRVDSLIANAGIGAYGSILDHPDEMVTAMIETNVTGTVWSVRAAVPAMLASGRGGDIVIIASVAGLRGGGDEAVYAATKFAEVGFVGSLNRELVPKGIRATAICPASTRTEFAMGVGRTPDMPNLATMLDPDDIALAVLQVLRQPRRMRTELWTLWSMSEVV